MNGGQSRRGFIKLGVLCGLGVLTGAYGLSSAYRFEVNTYRIPVPNLPPNFDGFTIVQLTDLHHGFGVPISFIDRVLGQVELLEKDVVVCTGDYIHGGDSRSAIDTIWARLMILRAREGVYSVLGNHDHMFNNGDYSLAWLEKSGQNVRHKAIPICRGKDRIWIGGAGDMWADSLEIDRAFMDTPPGECKILLSHNPDAAETEFATRVDLMISGHTHGGQIGAPPFTSSLSGLQEINGTQVFISRGIGWYMAPIRINCPPEISVLKLVPRDRGESGRVS